jgi:hypothetical protein
MIEMKRTFSRSQDTASNEPKKVIDMTEDDSD